jgi:hypothetical protein
MLAAELDEIYGKRDQIVKDRKEVFASEVEILKTKYKSYGKTEKSHLKRQAKEITEMYFSRKFGETTTAQWDAFCEARKILTALGCNDHRWA